MPFKTISFYKYIALESPDEWRDYFRTLCTNLQLLGRILVTKEGLNAAVSGKKENIAKFKKLLHQNQLFSDLTFREQEADIIAHHKLVVRVRPEIVHFGASVKFTSPGSALPPSTLQAWYDNNEDFVIIDVRNEYEYKIGKFRNAVTLPIHNFREFPHVAAEHLKQYKNKKIVLYCTGGIRCEKASAYLKQEGFEQVYQIEGGIINYVDQFPDSNSHWQGGLFVFDDRIVAEAGEPITTCTFCSKECEQYYNCHNLDCDELFITCVECKEKMKMTCSEECKLSPRQRKEISALPSLKTIGVVQSYFSKVGVAFVKLQERIKIDTSITLSGNTTAPFTQNIAQLRDEQGNDREMAAAGELVTFPVSSKVRKNDKLY